MLLLAASLLSFLPQVDTAIEAPETVQPEPIPVLIVSGANNHWWQWTTPSLRSMLEESGKFKVDVTETPAKTLATEDLSQWKALVLDYNGPRWGERAETRFLDAVAGGMGVVVVHAANNAFTGWVEYEKMVALCWREGTGHGRFHAFDVEVTDASHPITRGFDGLASHPDELYHRLVHMHQTDFRVLASAYSDPESGGTGEHEPMVIVKNYGRGRVFHTPLGHVWVNSQPNQVSHEDPQFRALIARGTEWAATGSVQGEEPAEPELNALSEAERKDGWSLLFDGNSTDHWRGYKKEGFPGQGWRIDDDAIQVQAGGGGGDIITKLPYTDFEFAFDWKVSEGANSGVMYRVAETDGASYMTGPEYQVLDDPNYPGETSPLTRSGALYGMVAAEGKALVPTGEYNRGRILVVGNHVEHWLNGVRVCSYELHDAAWKEMIENSKFKAWPGFGMEPGGHLCLQDHGNDVWFRNLKVRDLSARPAEAEPIFNGKDLSGWTYHLRDGGTPEQVWNVTDEGVLVCLGNPIGYMRTEADHKNYVMTLEWRFNPVTKKSGNSGVLLRMVGEDKVWPKSIEAQLHGGNAGDFWNIGEFPMKVVESRTNGRNTKKTHGNELPIGEWNRYEITVWRGHVVLRVNGEVLNQAWDCEEVAGKICLQSEGAEIHFRNIAIQDLD